MLRPRIGPQHAAYPGTHWLALLAACFLALLLAACGGGGGGGGSAAPAIPTVTLSGTVTYTSYPLNSTTGIQYTSPTNKPIRGAVIEVVNASSQVVATGNTSATGTYSIAVPQNSSLTVRVKAELGTPSAPDVKVVDNTSTDAVYALTFPVTTTTSNLTADANADSGWTGSDYTTTRAAAPFSILDVIYSAQQLVRSVNSSAMFFPLWANWSVNNVPTPGNLAAGQIGTSFYSNGVVNNDHVNLYILGAKGNDTDEYDTHVIAHEWGHYFEDRFFRSDNIGGSHSIGDLLDPRVAFGEGFGNAMGGIVLNDPIYVDTSGASQASVGVNFNLDADSVANTADSGIATLAGTGTYTSDGYYSETSVAELFYDLWDSPVSDDDGVQLGFQPLYNVLVGPHKSNAAFTSIFSLLYHLSQQNPASATAISTLAGAENVSVGSDGYEGANATEKLYTDLPTTNTTVSTDSNGVTLQTYAGAGAIPATGGGNKLFNHRFLGLTITTGGCYQIDIAPTSAVDIAFRIYEKGALLGQIDALGATTTAESTKATLTAGLYALDVYSLNAATAFTAVATNSTGCP